MWSASFLPVYFLWSISSWQDASCPLNDIEGESKCARALCDPYWNRDASITTCNPGHLCQCMLSWFPFPVLLQNKPHKVVLSGSLYLFSWFKPFHIIVARVVGWRENWWHVNMKAELCLFCCFQRHHSLALFYCYHNQPAQALAVWKRCAVRFAFYP